MIKILRKQFHFFFKTLYRKPLTEKPSQIRVPNQNMLGMSIIAAISGVVKVGRRGRLPPLAYLELNNILLLNFIIIFNYNLSFY